MADDVLPSPSIPATLLARAHVWGSLKRWERRELGREMRALGLSFREIAAVIPVSKGTLSAWCRGVELSAEMRARLTAKRPSALAMRENGQRKHQQAERRREAIREAARLEVDTLLNDPLWIAGVVAYWSEGAKTSNELRFSNSDPDLVLLFIAWARRCHGIEDFSAKLHLHSGQREDERVTYWSRVTGIDAARFGKTFFKPEGTGHRKRRLYNGTITVRASRSTSALQRTLGWISGLSEARGSL